MNAANVHKNKNCFMTAQLQHSRPGRGGQTAAREPHASLRTIPCGSLSPPNNYTFVFHFLIILQRVEIL